MNGVQCDQCRKFERGLPANWFKLSRTKTQPKPAAIYGEETDEERQFNEEIRRMGPIDEDVSMVYRGDVPKYYVEGVFCSLSCMLVFADCYAAVEG